MVLTPAQKKKIETIVSVFETSSLRKRYDTLVVLEDGPLIPGTAKRRKQITYGAHQATEYSSLKQLLQMYVDARGKHAVAFRPYLGILTKTPQHANEHFKRLLVIAAQDQTMQEVQDKFFEQFYWAPALNWARVNRFTLPLSIAVIYDSYIHSGGVPGWLRDDFAEKVPAAGGDERRWITAYVNARDRWLEGHPSKLLQNTDYRTDAWKEEIQQGNWDLFGPVVCKFNSVNPRNWITIL